jgi:hypothetical protein
MLPELIKHQEELFAAIIAPLNYRCLSALRMTCGTLFRVISGAYRWQHMRNFAPSLKQINSICRAILQDSRGIVTTIIYHNNYYAFYRMRHTMKLGVYRNIGIYDYNRIYDIIMITGSFLTVYRIDDTHIPHWLLKYTSDSPDQSYEMLVDLRP